MHDSFAHAPTQAAEFSGPGKQAIVLYTPEWSDLILSILDDKPAAYEAAWHFESERRAHVLMVSFEQSSTVGVALVDGVHNAVIARLAQGAALVLSPFPLYRDYEDQVVERLFEPETSLALPSLPSPLGEFRAN